MDRKTIYAGQTPLETDLLQAQQNAMVALAELSQTILGTPTLVDGFTVTPTVPGSLNIILTPGNIYQLENLEQSIWSSLPANTATSILKQGIQFVANGTAAGVGQSVTMGITPPGTTGYSQVFLVEVQYQDMDGGATVLPYFDAADPSDPFSGPANAGTAQNTVRYGGVAYQIKAGIAATTGTQLAPSPDAGWTGLFTITVANGATSITAGNILPYYLAPFLATNGKLPLIPTGVQNQTWTYAVDTGTVNNMVVTVAPTPAQYEPGMRLSVKVNHTNTDVTTINVNNLGTVAVHRANGAQLSSGDINAGMVVSLVYDGSAFQVENFEGFTSSTTNNNTYTIDIPYAQDTGTANTVVASFTPAITSLPAGTTVEVKIAANNTGASTIAVNSLAAVPIVDCSGLPLAAGMLSAGQIAFLVYNGSAFQLFNGFVIDSSVSYSVYGEGANFSSLAVAMEYLGKFRITPNGYVSLNLASGQISAGSSQIALSHPNSDRIGIFGAGMKSSPSHSIFSTTGNKATDRTADLTALRNCYDTELDFTASGGLNFQSPGWGLYNILLVGDRGANEEYVALCFALENITLSNVSAHGCGGYGIATNGGLMAFQGFVSATGCIGPGIGAAWGSFIVQGLVGQNIEICSYSNDDNGIIVQQAGFGGDVGTVNIYSMYNGGSGMLVENGSNAAIIGGSFSYNDDAGFYVQNSQLALLDNAVTIAGNSHWGIAAFDTAGVNGGTNVQLSTNNGDGNVLSENGSTVNLTGVSNVSGYSSPGVNTVGNNNAIIIN